jgi:hypothetical protein
MNNMYQYENKSMMQSLYIDNKSRQQQRCRGGVAYILHLTDSCQFSRS